MKLIDKIKNKLFPDEKEILYYENKNISEQKENRFSEKVISDTKMPITYKPISFSSTQEISDSLKQGNIVVVDISLLDKSDALRMIDFLGGVMYSLNGEMKRLNKTTFEFSVEK